MSDLEKIKEELNEYDIDGDGLPDASSPKFKISLWKLVIGSIVIPVISTFAIIFTDRIETGTWNWVLLLNMMNIITVPAITSWLSDIFNVKEKKTVYEYEKIIKKLKKDHAREKAELKDENYAYKIKSGLQEYALEKNNINLPDYDKYTDLDVNT